MGDRHAADRHPGLGSGESWQHDDARTWAARSSPAANGICAPPPRCWRRCRKARVVLSVDCDGIDPAAFPAVAMPTPGGLSYEDMLDVLHGIAGRARLAGLILAEYVPERDGPHRLCAAMAARLASVALGLVPPA